MSRLVKTKPPGVGTTRTASDPVYVATNRCRHPASLQKEDGYIKCISFL